MKYFFQIAITILILQNHGAVVTASKNIHDQFSGTDVSSLVFGADDSDIFPVAYFDVNSDKLTDLVAVSKERTSIDIFLAMSQPPYLPRAFHSEDITLNHPGKKIVSVRPGDFTGNGLADLMVTLGKDDEVTCSDYRNCTGNNSSVDIVFCTVKLLGSRHLKMNLTCSGPGAGSVVKGLTQEPTVLDLNGDMILDFIGEQWINATKNRYVWFSEATRDSFEWNKEAFRVIGNYSNETVRDMTSVSSNAFADIDGDGIPELIILTKEDEIVPNGSKDVYFLETYEIVKDGQERIAFQFKTPPEFVNTSSGDQTQVIGQPMLIDFQHTGKLEQLFPYCTSLRCDTDIGIYVIHQGHAYPLPMGSLMYEGVRWSFIPKQHHKPNSTFHMENFYSQALSLRVGDYNLDGFPDLLGVLRAVGKPGESRTTRAVLFENVPCVPAPGLPCHYNRTFSPNFEMFKTVNTNVISASFYDIRDNGALDVILVSQRQHQQAPQYQRFVIQAFENGMNFDATFLKVMVLTGHDCEECDGSIPYGNVLPGATIRYTSPNTNGVEESGVVTQTYRTSHMTLDLPCNVFGIGHSPNFIETLSVSIAHPNVQQPYRREWTQIIPNSQIVVVPKSLTRPTRWTMLLFLTPSDVVLKTFAILVGVCLILGTLAGGLEFMEKREDRRLRQSEAHRMALWLS